MKTGNTGARRLWSSRSWAPQWSPVMKTGNTGGQGGCGRADLGPQWSPVMKTGNTCADAEASGLEFLIASMEPGHEDREYRGTLRKDPKMATSLNGARS